MAEPPIEETTPRSEHHRRWILIACGAVAVLVLVALAVRVATWPSSPQAADPVLANLPSSTAELAASEQAILQSVENERRSMARVKLVELRQAADMVLAALGKLEQEDQLWKTQVVALLTNDTGRGLAAEEEHVKAFESVYENRVSTHPFIENKRSLIRIYMEPVDAALGGDAALYEPAPTLLEQMHEEAREVQNRLTQAREARGTIRSLCSAAGPGSARGESRETLQQALDRLKQRESAALAEKLAAARDRVATKNREELVALEERKLEEIGEADRARREAELEARRAGIETEAQLVEEQERMKRLRKLAEDPAVQAKYQPFLGKGRTILGSRGVWGGTKYYEPPAPVSYNRLVATGVTNNLKRFVQAGCGVNPFHLQDRPRWKYPATEQDWEDYRQLHEEFGRLAPLWRDMGLLQK